MTRVLLFSTAILETKLVLPLEGREKIPQVHGYDAFPEPTVPNLAQPRWGCKSPTPQSQGSLASSATLGFEAESLWDSWFEVVGQFQTWLGSVSISGFGLVTFAR